MQAEFEKLESYLKKSIFPSSASLQITEISEGNINHIYRAEDLHTGRSVILKQAEEVSRISPDIRLNPDRGKRETAYFGAVAALLPEAVPKVFAYDADLHLIVMEDMQGYSVLRKPLLEGEVFLFLGEQLGRYVADTTLFTSDFFFSHKAKKESEIGFCNPELCDLTERLVFTDPFVGAKDNFVCEENRDFVETHIYRNESLRALAAKFKFRFMNAREALIHGDLHFGSVFVNPRRIVVFDPEFCFFGPIGFDLGNLLAHFLMEFQYVRLSRPNDSACLAWLRQMTKDLLLTFEARFQSEAGRVCKDAVLKAPLFLKEFLSGVFVDTAGFAGVECLRRTIGIAKIAEFDLLSASDRALYERRIINTGVFLMEHAQTVSDAGSLLALLETI